MGARGIFAEFSAGGKNRDDSLPSSNVPGINKEGPSPVRTRPRSVFVPVGDPVENLALCGNGRIAEPWRSELP